MGRADVIGGGGRGEGAGRCQELLDDGSRSGRSRRWTDLRRRWRAGGTPPVAMAVATATLYPRPFRQVSGSAPRSEPPRGCWSGMRALEPKALAASGPGPTAARPPDPPRRCGSTGRATPRRRSLRVAVGRRVRRTRGTVDGYRHCWSASARSRRRGGSGCWWRRVGRCAGRGRNGSGRAGLAGRRPRGVLRAMLGCGEPGSQGAPPGRLVPS
jgi:hypothetical protein